MNAPAKATYTSGPWVFSGGDSAPILHIYAPDNKHLFHKDRSLEEQEANARLMSAAPDLLAAVKALDAALCDGFDTRYGRHAGRMALIKAREAVAKAESAQ